MTGSNLGKGTSLKEGLFVPKTVILDSEAVSRALRRISYEVLERNGGSDELVLIGLKGGGAPFVQAIGKEISRIESKPVEVFELDISPYRDDLKHEPNENKVLAGVTVQDKIVVIVDDVLFTGRTIRAAMDAVMDLGRPKAIQLLVMIDRGHRELPIRADFVGKNLPTKRVEAVRATLQAVEIGELSLS